MLVRFDCCAWYWILIVVVIGSSVREVAAEPEKPAMSEHQHLCQLNGMDLKTLSQCGITLLSHAPCGVDAEQTKQFIAEAHALGIKLLPYVSPEKSWYLDTPERLKAFIHRNPGASVPYYRAVDPSSHPEWILIDEMGRPSPRYGSYVQDEFGESVITWTRWSSNDFKEVSADKQNKFTWYMCPSAEGYIDAVERGVRAVMDLGFDGVFVDNIYNGRLAFCHGEKLGEHKHRNPDRNSDKTYPEIVERIYKTVKSYGPDKIVLLNNGLENTFAPFRDAAMYESYMATIGRKGRLLDWKAVLSLARRFADEPEHGRAVTALSYVGDTGYPPKDDCFYTCACAQLSGFKWSGNGPRMDVVRLLYRARLIVPAGAMVEADGIWHRAYDRGLVVVNPAKDKEVSATLPLPAGLNDPVDLYSGQTLNVNNGQVVVTVPAESGRVIVAREAAVNNYLIECATTLGETAAGLEGTSENELAHLPTLSGTSWPELAQTGKTLADELLPLALARQNTAGGDQDGAIRDRLTKIKTLLGALPASDDKRVVRLGASAQYAKGADDLMPKN